MVAAPHDDLPSSTNYPTSLPCSVAVAELTPRPRKEVPEGSTGVDA